MTLPKRRHHPPMGLRASTVIRAPNFLAFVCKHECAAYAAEGCEGDTEAAHVRVGTDGGVGIKPSDCYALPLCSKHHRRQHQIGERAFEKEAKISMRSTADEMWALWLKSTDAGRKWKLAHG